MINQQKLSQMDRPNVNLKLLRNSTTGRQEGGLPYLLDCGVCNQHTLHNAFKDGAKKTGWDLKAVMQAAYYVFHECPSRRETFTKVTGKANSLASSVAYG